MAISKIIQWFGSARAILFLTKLLLKWFAMLRITCHKECVANALSGVNICEENKTVMTQILFCFSWNVLYLLFNNARKTLGVKYRGAMFIKWTCSRLYYSVSLSLLFAMLKQKDFQLHLYVHCISDKLNRIKRKRTYSRVMKRE